MMVDDLESDSPKEVSFWDRGVRATLLFGYTRKSHLLRRFREGHERLCLVGEENIPQLERIEIN